MSTVKVNRLIGNSDHNFEIHMPSSANLLINGSYTADIDSGLVLPVGTTAQRPGTPATGMIRFNTDIDYFEGYNENLRKKHLDLWSQTIFSLIVFEFSESFEIS